MSRLSFSVELMSGWFGCVYLYGRPGIREYARIRDLVHVCVLHVAAALCARTAPINPIRIEQWTCARQQWPDTSLSLDR